MAAKIAFSTVLGVTRRTLPEAAGVLVGASATSSRVFARSNLIMRPQTVRVTTLNELAAVTHNQVPR